LAYFDLPYNILVMLIVAERLLVYERESAAGRQAPATLGDDDARPASGARTPPGRGPVLRPRPLHR
jgi:hypothetical protein